MNVEGRPGLWVDTEADEGAGAPGYVVVPAWSDGKVSGTRDFRYVRYAGETLPQGASKAQLTIPRATNFRLGTAVRALNESCQRSQDRA